MKTLAAPDADCLPRLSQWKRMPNSTTPSNHAMPESKINLTPPLAMHSLIIYFLVVKSISLGWLSPLEASFSHVQEVAGLAPQAQLSPLTVFSLVAFSQLQ